jgi:hypothetical protein
MRDAIIGAGKNSIMVSFIFVLLVKYNWNDQVKEGEIGGVCKRHGENRNAYRFQWDNQKERNHWENLDVYGRLILKWILDK